MKRLVPIMASAVALAACSASAPEQNVHIGNHRQESVVRYVNVLQLPVLPGRPGAGYFSVAVPAGQGALISVTSPQAGRIEMHETSQQEGMTRMRPIQRISPEDDQLVLMPRGRHLMLFDVDAAITPGGAAQFVLRFENGQTRTIDARVIEAGGEHGGH